MVFAAAAARAAGLNRKSPRGATNSMARCFPMPINPFALPSIMGSWEWLDPKAVDMGPYLRRRGLVFVDGKPLEPVEQQRELAAPHLPACPGLHGSGPAADRTCRPAGAADRSCRRLAVRRMPASGWRTPGPAIQIRLPRARPPIT